MTATLTADYLTENHQRITRGERATLVGSDGTRFAGTSIGVCVSRGVLFAAFEAVDGDVPTTGKRRFVNVPLANLTVDQRPLVLGR
jgi:hypothetical protein